MQWVNPKGYMAETRIACTPKQLDELQRLGLIVNAQDRAENFRWIKSHKNMLLECNAALFLSIFDYMPELAGEPEPQESSLPSFTPTDDLQDTKPEDPASSSKDGAKAEAKDEVKEEAKDETKDGGEDDAMQVEQPTQVEPQAETSALPAAASSAAPPVQEPMSEPLSARCADDRDRGSEQMSEASSRYKNHDLSSGSSSESSSNS